MKRIILLFMLMMVTTISLNAQEGVQWEYHPLLKEGKEWHEEYLWGAGNLGEIIFTIRGTSVFDNTEYFNLYSKRIIYEGIGFEDGIGIIYAEKGEESEETLYAYLREEDGKVKMLKDGKETLLYDFTLQKGQVYPLSDTQKLTVDEIDVVVIDANTFRRLAITEADTEVYEWLIEKGHNPEENLLYWSKSGYWIEGVGSYYGLLQPFGWVGSLGLHRLTKCYEQGALIYSSEDAAVHEPSGIEQVRQAMDSKTASPLFDFQGRRLNGAPTKGMYIKDGKKHVVR